MNENKKTVFDHYKLLFDGKEEDLDKIPNSSLFVLIRWLSFCRTNVNICQRLNLHYKYVNHNILKWILYYKIDIDERFIKYKKAIKDEKLSFVKEYLKKYFNYSEREYIYIKPIIDNLLLKDDFKYSLNKIFGFSESECRKLNIKFMSFKKKRKDTDSVSLFSFVKKKCVRN